MKATVSSTVTLGAFISDASTLGKIRFINISGGPVLETIGRFDYSTKVFEVPGQGKYLRLANDGKTFECHRNLAKISRVAMSKEKAKMGTTIYMSFDNAIQTIESSSHMCSCVTPLNLLRIIFTVQSTRLRSCRTSRAMRLR